MLSRRIKILQDISEWDIPVGQHTGNQMTETRIRIIHKVELFAIIHNGIIENYSSIKAELSKRGHIFKSDTDTEVLVHLIEDIFRTWECHTWWRVRLALGEVIGHMLSLFSPKIIRMNWFARKGSPIVLGVGKEKGMGFVASDATQSLNIPIM